MKGVEKGIRPETRPVTPQEAPQTPQFAPERPKLQVPDRFDKGSLKLPTPLVWSGTLSNDFNSWRSDLPKRAPSDLPKIKRLAQDAMNAREGGALRKLVNGLRGFISPSFRAERQAYKNAFAQLMAEINSRTTNATTKPNQQTQVQRPQEHTLPTTKARQPEYSWSLQSQPSWSEKLSSMSDAAVIDQAAQILSTALQAPLREVRSQFRTRGDAESFLRENLPEGLRYGALSEAPRTASSFAGEFHGVPTAWALSAPEFGGRYGARSIEGDGSCWLTSGLYSTLSQGLKNDESAKRLAQNFGEGAELLARPDIQGTLAGQSGFSSTPEAARALAQKAQSLVQDLYMLKKSKGDTLPPSITSRLNDVDQALLMSHGKDAWRIWMSEPQNMALLRDFGTQVMAAKIVENLKSIGVDFKDPDNYAAQSARETVSETLSPRVEQGPEALAGLAQLTGIEIPYISYNVGKTPKASALISDPSLQRFADAGMPILLYGPYAKDGSGSQMHYSVLEPLSTQ